MKETLNQIREDAMKEISNSDGLLKLNEVKARFLGKKGELTTILKSMKDVSQEERPVIGQLVNETREILEGLFENAKSKIEAAELDYKMKNETIDVTLPGKKIKVGHAHPNDIALRQVEDIFVGMGYEVGGIVARTANLVRESFVVFFFNMSQVKYIGQLGP